MSIQRILMVFLFQHISTGNLLPILSAACRRLLIISICIIITTSSIFSNCIVSCTNSFNLALGTEGYTVITPGVLLLDQGCDPNDFKVEIIDASGNTNSDTIDCNHVGFTITAKLIEIATNNSCNTIITVFDNIPPHISCIDTTLLCGQDTSVLAIGFPDVFDNCTSLTQSDLAYVDIVSNYDCFEVVNGDTLNALIERQWSAIDLSGNSTTCSQFIKLKKSNLADVSFPPHLNGVVAPSLDCQQDPLDLELTGYPNILGIPINASNHCDFSATFTDQTIPNCGGSFLVLRSWVIADWCANEFENYTQFIKVEDNTTPVVSCPSDMTVSTEVYKCTAIVNLPNTTATDDCSSVVITPVWSFGTGYGPFTNIPIGNHVVNYIAEDECGNKDTCTITVSVLDLVAPVNICKPNNVVSLGVSGESYLSPNVFDDGTYDACGLKEFKVAKDGINFSDLLYVNCLDVENSPLEVTLRAIDLYDNYNDCTVLLNVIDGLAPEIICPDSITLSCENDIYNLEITGQPLLFDNCSIDTFYYEDEEFLNLCNVGYVKRNWSVFDSYGHFASCSQIINLVDSTALEVVFPGNYTTNVCNENLNPEASGEVQVLNDNCEFLSITHTDDTLNQAFPACFVIFRKWKVIDWCSYDHITGVGLYEHTQVISIIDNKDPELAVPSDSTVFSFSENCNGQLVALEDAIGLDCSPSVQISNNSPYAWQSGPNASGEYPVGVHQITYTAMDGCGNSSTEILTLTIVDAKAPTVVCRSGVAVELEAFGEVNIDLADVLLIAFDNCSNIDNLIYSVTPNHFSCEDLGSQSVLIEVEDEMGNIGYCETTILVQDNSGGCPVGTISGFVKKWNDEAPINEVHIEISGPEPDAMKTDAAFGSFSFSNLPIGANYNVKATKDGNDREGLSTLDLILLSRHLVGLTPLQSPEQLLAGDVTGDNHLNTFDLFQIQKLILVVDTILPNVDSWRLVPKDFSYSNPSFPFADNPPNSIQINNLQTGMTNIEFVGIKMGDVSGNADPSLSSNYVETNLEDFIAASDHAKVRVLSSMRQQEVYGFSAQVILTDALDSYEVQSIFPFQLDSYLDLEDNVLRIIGYSSHPIAVDRDESLFEIVGEKLGLVKKNNIDIKIITENNLHTLE